MSTSGQIGGKLVVKDYITTAMELLGILAPGNEPEADEYDSGIRYLNSMLKAWQSDGCNLWRDEVVTIDWPAATAECDLSPTVMDIISARYVQSGTYQRWLARWERGDYDLLPNKVSVGTPTMFVFVKTTSNPKLILWPVPSEAVTISANVARVTEDVTEVDQEVDLPQEWAECVYFNLASRMAGTMATGRVDPRREAQVRADAAEMYARMSSFDRPASYTFEPWNRR
ncbi:MAG: hypothetical protein Q7T61_00925 [Caulobacter sp.]|nr:hypothetical protein [Caulobacter sp.]